MTATDADHERNLLAAIRRATLDGDDDLAERAALADLWMESGGDVECKACGGSGEGKRDFDGYPRDCPACHGSGRVSDGRRERGEFVAVQLELAGLEEQIREMQSQFPSPHRKPLILPDVTYSSPRYESACDRRDALRRRERELIDAHGRKWLPLGEEEGHFAAITDVRFVGIDRTYFFRGGFIESIALPIAALCRGACPRCGGRGWYIREIGDDEMSCLDCNGTGRTPGIYRELGRACPTLERVTVTGMPELVRIRFGPDEGKYVWNLSDIPESLHDSMREHEHSEFTYRFASPAAAHAALNAAALRLIFPERNPTDDRL